jgi:hypothetical protein
VSLTVPKVTHADEVLHRRELAIAIQQLAKGRTNSAGTVTLTLASATTVVTDERAASDSAILLMPNDANAAVENWWITPANGSFTINHANNALTRTFKYAIVG